MILRDRPARVADPLPPWGGFCNGPSGLYTITSKLTASRAIGVRSITFNADRILTNICRLAPAGAFVFGPSQYIFMVKCCTLNIAAHLLSISRRYQICTSGRPLQITLGQDGSGSWACSLRAATRQITGLGHPSYTKS